MGKMMEITSFSNPKIKEVIQLRKRKKREEKKLFLIEGYREILRAYSQNIEIEKLFVCEEFFLGTNEGSLIEKLTSRKVPIISCQKKIFEKISYRDRPDGLLAVAVPTYLTFQDLEKKVKNPLFLIAEHIEKPGNLGSILRSCDGAGVDGVIICDPCTDIFNPNVVRASIGTLFTQKVVIANNEDTFSFLNSKNIPIIAATPSANKCYTEIDFTKKAAILVGSEQYGLSSFWIKHATLRVSIPMQGEADSLNVAAATTILLYEALRQRNIS